MDARLRWAGVHNKIWRKTLFNMVDGIITPCNVPRSWHWFRQVTAPYNVAWCSGIIVNLPSGSTLQCDTWLWDDMLCNSPKRLPYWNSTSGFDFDHITAVDMSFCTRLRKFIQIGPPSAEKMTLCQFSRWRISAILDFRGSKMGSLKSPCTTSYRDHGSKLFSVWENRVVVFWRQTDRQTNRWTGPLHEAALAVESGGLTRCIVCFGKTYPMIWL